MQSRTRGRSQTSAEVVLLLFRYRDFSRIALGKVPDAKTLARIGQAISGEVIAELHRRLVQLALGKGVVQGRKMRVDTVGARRCVRSGQGPLMHDLTGRCQARADHRFDGFRIVEVHGDVGLEIWPAQIARRNGCRISPRFH